MAAFLMKENEHLCITCCSQKLQQSENPFFPRVLQTTIWFKNGVLVIPELPSGFNYEKESEKTKTLTINKIVYI